ncbi:MAG: CvpA family protein [Alphaproteobacteria bacterium]|nr:CvpA family protein [Alphaproteobacteria bacterium]
MIQTQLSIFDMVVCGIMFLSCLFAFFRGFVREVLSLGAWIGAGAITLYYFPTVSQKLEPQFKNPIAAGGLAAIGLYVLSLIGFSILNRIIMKFVKSGSDVGMLDNLLGLMFGALRGAFIISLGYLLLVFAIGENTRPEWMRGAFTLPYVIKGANILSQSAPEYMHDITSFQKSTTDSMMGSSTSQPVHLDGNAPIIDGNTQNQRLIQGIQEEIQEENISNE